MTKYRIDVDRRDGWIEATVNGKKPDIASVTRFRDGSIHILVGRSLSYEGAESVECADYSDARDLLAAVTEALRLVTPPLAGEAAS